MVFTFLNLPNVLVANIFTYLRAKDHSGLMQTCSEVADIGRTTAAMPFVTFEQAANLYSLTIERNCRIRHATLGYEHIMDGLKRLNAVSLRSITKVDIYESDLKQLMDCSLVSQLTHLLIYRKDTNRLSKKTAHLLEKMPEVYPELRCLEVLVINIAEIRVLPQSIQILKTCYCDDTFIEILKRLTQLHELSIISTAHEKSMDLPLIALHTHAPSTLTHLRFDVWNDRSWNPCMVDFNYIGDKSGFAIRLRNLSIKGFDQDKSEPGLDIRLAGFVLQFKSLSLLSLDGNIDRCDQLLDTVTCRADGLLPPQLNICFTSPVRDISGVNPLLIQSICIELDHSQWSFEPFEAMVNLEKCTLVSTEYSRSILFVSPALRNSHPHITYWQIGCHELPHYIANFFNNMSTKYLKDIILYVLPKLNDIELSSLQFTPIEGDISLLKTE